MTGGIKAFVGTLALAAAGCTADSGELNIRAVTDPLTKAMNRGNPLIAEARGLLALGNVGLAIEAYRKVLREQPDSVEALAGLAECYDRMGRHDLSRARYEAALAIAPKNPVLLRTFAASLDRQGRRQEAIAVRIEANQADAAGAAALAKNGTHDVPAKSGLAEAPVAAAPSPAAVLAPPSKWKIDALPAQPSAGSIKVKLPPLEAPRSHGTQENVARAVEKPDRNPVPNRRARLERLSLAEVALVTTTEPRWRAEVVRRTASSTTIRFVPLDKRRHNAGVRLLNAARRQGLAARTRVALNRKGWASVTIGDAARIRERTLVLYSPATMAAARRLAAEFGFGIARDPRPGPLTVLLGRDAVGRSTKKG